MEGSDEILFARRCRIDARRRRKPRRCRSADKSPSLLGYFAGGGSTGSTGGGRCDAVRPVRISIPLRRVAASSPLGAAGLPCPVTYNTDLRNFLDTSVSSISGHIA